VSLDDIQALPIIYNYLFYLKDEDTSIRSQARFGIEKLIERIAFRNQDNNDKNTLVFVVTDIIYPAIIAGMHSTQALFRRVGYFFIYASNNRRIC
jgi:hypothetical protein